MNYAVIFRYTFDEEIAVYLFATIEEAKAFLKGAYEEELKIDIEENEYDTHSYFSEDGLSAAIFNRFYDRTDITYMDIGNIYE